MKTITLLLIIQVAFVANVFADCKTESCAESCRDKNPDPQLNADGCCFDLNIFHGTRMECACCFKGECSDDDILACRICRGLCAVFNQSVIPAPTLLWSCEVISSRCDAVFFGLKQQKMPNKLTRTTNDTSLTTDTLF